MDQLLTGLQTYDTTSPTGWKINYLTDKDSSILVIQWSKGGFLGMDTIPNKIAVLRNDYRPTFGGESKSNIYMPYRCANDCDALLVLSKETPKDTTLFHILNYDTNSDRVVMFNDEGSDMGKLKVDVFSLKSNKDTSITFENSSIEYSDIHKERFIDSIVFEEGRTIIQAVFPDKDGGFKKQRKTAAIQ